MDVNLTDENKELLKWCLWLGRRNSLIGSHRRKRLDKLIEKIQKIHYLGLDNHLIKKEDNERLFDDIEFLTNELKEKCKKIKLAIK
mgnify:CR=1 FL=1